MLKSQADQGSAEYQDGSEEDAEVGQGEICRPRRIGLRHKRYSPQRSLGYDQNILGEWPQVIPIGNWWIRARDVSRFLERFSCHQFLQ